MTLTLRPARVLSVLAAVAVLVAVVLVWRAQGQDDTPITTAAVPYDDPQAAGLLTLCSADGEPVTGGRTADTPFADLVVGETGVPAEFDPTGAVATVFAYQPRQGVSPAEFSGSPISAASVLDDPAHPAAAVPADAWSLGDFVTAFPADWDGYVQLRLYLGTPAAGTLSTSPYDTADLRVDGDTWELVRGGEASCSSDS